MRGGFEPPIASGGNTRHTAEGVEQHLVRYEQIIW
jgi:hypothetical protein